MRLSATIGWVLFSSCLRLAEPRPDAEPPLRIVLSPSFELTRLDDSTWIHTTWKELPGVGPFPSNGLLVRGDGGVVLVDTPWTPEATRTLVDWVGSRLQLPITDLIVTHFHDDRTGGVSALGPATKVHALELTSRLSMNEGRPLHAEALPQGPRSLVLSGEPFTTLAPGPGHSPDTLVVWSPLRRLLVGGCFVRAAGSKTLGNLADADVDRWGASLAVVRAAFLSDPEGVRVLPGHGPLGGPELVTQTEALVAAHLARP